MNNKNESLIGIEIDMAMCAAIRQFLSPKEKRYLINVSDEIYDFVHTKLQKGKITIISDVITTMINMCNKDQLNKILSKYINSDRCCLKKCKDSGKIISVSLNHNICNRIEEQNMANIVRSLILYMIDNYSNMI